jgi:hypothetical protein
MGDDGRMTHAQRVIPGDLDSAHFRECLIERLRWAIGDADVAGGEVAAARRRYREPLSIRAARSGGGRGAARERRRGSPRQARASASSW